MRKFYCIIFFGNIISTKLSWLICTFPSQHILHVTRNSSFPYEQPTQPKENIKNILA